MEQQLTKKYGLPTAICMVVGIVIGSGIFFKAEKILNATGGDLRTGILAWIIGGLIAISNACAFAVMATRYQKVGGMVDYAEAAVGRAYGYYLGWFLAAVYYPCLTSTLAWVSARYTCVLLGYDIVSGECMTITLFYLVAAYFINTMAPRLAGKLQVSMTLIKLVPILLMAGMGTAAGLRSGMTAANFAQVTADTVTAYPLFTALAATAFAYEGWVVATTINAELKDPKRTLPLALVCGVGIIMLIYLFYYVGIAGAVPNAVMMESGEHGHLQRADDGLHPGILRPGGPGNRAQASGPLPGGPLHRHDLQRGCSRTAGLRLLGDLLLFRLPPKSSGPLPL